MDIDGWEQEASTNVGFSTVYVHSFDDHEEQLDSSWNHSRLQKWLEHYLCQSGELVCSLLQSQRMKATQLDYKEVHTYSVRAVAQYSTCADGTCY